MAWAFVGETARAAASLLFAWLLLAAPAAAALTWEALPQIPDARAQAEAAADLVRMDLAAGRLTGLLAKADDAVGRARTQFGELSQQHASALELRADVRAASSDVSAAADDLTTALAIWEKIYTDRNPALRFELERIAQTFDALERRGASIPETIRARASSQRIAALAALETDPQHLARVRTKSSDGDKGFARVPVFYGTTRRRVEGAPLHLAYGFERAPLTYGVVEVSIPDDHEFGQLEAPNWYEVQYLVAGPDPSQHVVMLGLSQLEPDEFRARLRARASGTGKEVFLFIHGYNTTFDHAAMRTAQMAFDLEVDGPAVMFSWPSRGTWTAYADDRAECTPEAQNTLARFIANVAAATPGAKLNVLAHSMGNCFAVPALAQLGREGKRTSDEVVLAAPDISPASLESALKDLSAAAGRITLYASRNDSALVVSELIASEPRVGVMSPVFTARALEAIDASSLAAPDAYGHSYFSGPALGDVRAVFWLNLPPAKRCWLSPLMVDPGPAFEMKPALCNDVAFRMALILVRRLGIEAAAKRASDMADTPGLSPGDRRLWQQTADIIPALR